MLAPGGTALFGMVNRHEGTFLGPYFRNESWWAPVARRCGFESAVTSSEFTEWRGGPARYHAYLKKAANHEEDAQEGEEAYSSPSVGDGEKAEGGSEDSDGSAS